MRERQSITKPQLKDWTVVLYFAADNNLSPFAVRNLNQISKTGSSDQIAIVAEVDRPRVLTQIYDFQKRSSSLKSSKIKSLKNINSGNPQSLKRFLRYAIRLHPAKHYLVVVWGHGSGVDFQLLQRIAPGKELRRRKQPATLNIRSHSSAFLTSDAYDGGEFSIAPDYSSKSFIRNDSLSKVFRSTNAAAGRQIDIAALDACYMAISEVNYELRDSADFLVASENVVPKASFPYAVILRRLKAAPQLTPRDLSKVIVDAYADVYQHKHIYTLSATDLSKAELLAEAIAGLTAALRDQLKSGIAISGIMHARHVSQSFLSNLYVDLRNLCMNLRKCKALPESVSIACTRLLSMTSGNGSMIVASRHGGSTLSRACGLGLYFPEWNLTEGAKMEWDKSHAKGGVVLRTPRTLSAAAHVIDTLYSDLSFRTSTKWDLFLIDYFKACTAQTDSVEAGRKLNNNKRGEDRMTPTKQSSKRAQKKTTGKDKGKFSKPNKDDVVVKSANTKRK